MAADITGPMSPGSVNGEKLNICFDASCPASPSLDEPIDLSAVRTIDFQFNLTATGSATLRFALWIRQS